MGRVHAIDDPPLHHVDLQDRVPGGNPERARGRHRVQRFADLIHGAADLVPRRLRYGGQLDPVVDGIAHADRVSEEVRTLPTPTVRTCPDGRKLRYSAARTSVTRSVSSS